MDTADDMDFGNSRIALIQSELFDLVEREVPRLRIVGRAAVGAEAATEAADVGRLDVDVAVVVHRIAVLPAPHPIGQHPEQGKRRTLPQHGGLGGCYPFAVFYLIGNGPDTLGQVQFKHGVKVLISNKKEAPAGTSP